ncbi:hypothetical protein O3P69_005257 [Scylla paramamosain]|uniref:Uncharacterized protein n=1 Tax=Scylla paramamosain TaxID=85552 RepID=A0AAW0U935_SCYPA
MADSRAPRSPLPLPPPNFAAGGGGAGGPRGPPGTGGGGGGGITAHLTQPGTTQHNTGLTQLNTIHCMNNPSIQHHTSSNTINTRQLNTTHHHISPKNAPHTLYTSQCPPTPTTPQHQP